jgi:hypothetical protein
MVGEFFVENYFRLAVRWDEALIVGKKWGQL